MSSKVIYRRCLPGGPWQRLLPGIIVLHNTTPTTREQLLGALVYAGPKSMVTGAAACRQYGLRVPAVFPARDVHLLIPQQHKATSTEFLTVERTWRLPAPHLREGIPLAPLVRAVTDAARRMRTEEPVGELLVEALQRGRCSPGAINAELDRGTKRGTALPRRLLAEWLDLRSVAEARAKELSRRLAIPPSHWNPEVHDAAGTYIGRPDGWWDDVALAWEIDSVDFHFSRDGYARTLRRNSRYAAAGISVVPTLPSRLRDDPGGVLAELEAAYRAAAARPRPPVFLPRQAA
ncbi:hypothetical protein QRX60_07075 [Amycolatopsis mongoliensis]|uniref:AbiEi antitoxin C-terminal domain-containing protein n=1 Tax=Amycolatopsis mongoliensis TaxID=715475 RepID=A0A9Y2JSW8_9PSEU|nr:hypothetical protein [Amycolatopsis sp. 4-36]WIY03608.1 hypothetical protein QRX60_07075 [Amycolatopsis sp. 4-36]